MKNLFAGLKVPSRLSKGATSTSTSKVYVRLLSNTSGRERISLLRNIGISAHIDSGKTTLTERILYYSGRISAIHEVRGKDGVGAKMDSMDLEREKGITIQSAATHTTWKENNINIIDTPGHIDFTVEVERALRVLDGAIMVLCGVAGVQSQSITVDRQMKRYGVPRLAFINKLDRNGSNPENVLLAMRSKLRLNAALVQIPIGLEEHHKGVVDLVRSKAYINDGDFGEIIKEIPIPDDLLEIYHDKRKELIALLADVDDTIGDLYLLDEEPTVDQIVSAIRKGTQDLSFVPVFVGSAFKNKGIQALLDGVVEYLPSPVDREYSYLDQRRDEEKVQMVATNDKPLVALAFKLEEGKFGQLTYIRLYQGKIARGDTIRNTANNKKVKVSRLVKMHANEMVEEKEADAGDICALFGIECRSGDTFCNANDKHFEPTMLSMHVPDPVVSLAVKPKEGSKKLDIFSKALQRFQKEDPTFKVSVDPESKETIVSGMGELHLEVYLERMRREYACETISGQPKVNYREAISNKVEFTYLHKKQTGGSGQYGKIIGWIEPLTPDMISEAKEDNPALPDKVVFLFENKMIGNVLDPNYVTAVEKGFREAMESGPLIGHPVEGVKVVLTDGQSHSVDSSELAFVLAAKGAFKEAFLKSDPIVLEPIMNVEVQVPEEYQGDVAGALNQRHGTISNSETSDGYCTIEAAMSLKEMFGFTTVLRSLTQAKGDFSMEYREHAPLGRGDIKTLIENRQKQNA